MDPDNWSDERLDALLDQLAERAEERDDISLPGSGVTRRATLAGLLGLGGAAAGGAGLAAAIGESESYGNSTGVVGSDSEPLQELNAKNGHFQSAVVDNSLQTEQLTSNGAAYPWTRIDASNEVDDSNPQLSFATATLSSLPSDAYAALLNLRSTGDGSAGRHFVETREAGSSRKRDAVAVGWAGHSAEDANAIGSVPVNSNNEIEYATFNSSAAKIDVIGYF